MFQQTLAKGNSLAMCNPVRELQVYFAFEFAHYLEKGFSGTWEHFPPVQDQLMFPVEKISMNCLWDIVPLVPPARLLAL
uniref:Uncharacterized protein n=1 Tax=Romanomermis culicivorax TaxID=13658 RepID=A0A915J7G6_ROMCU